MYKFSKEKGQGRNARSSGQALRMERWGLRWGRTEGLQKYIVLGWEQEESVVSPALPRALCPHL